MVEHSEWLDHNLIADLIFRMRSEYTELLTHELEDRELALLSHPGNPMDVDTRLWVDATEFLVLSPPRIWEAFHSFVGAGGENYLTDIAEIVDLLSDSIGDWEGAAAQAFVAHISNIESFVRFQNQYIDDMLLGYAAAYKHAVQIRESYKSLVEEWIEVARKYREDSDERERASGSKSPWARSRQWRRWAAEGRCWQSDSVPIVPAQAVSGRGRVLFSDVPANRWSPLDASPCVSFLPGLCGVDRIAHRWLRS